MSADAKRPIAQNRKARHDYIIESTLEAGLVLTGSEVKSLRRGRCSIGEAYAHEQGGELYLRGMHISPYEAANRRNHEPLRPRKLLVHRRELAKLLGQVQRGGYTLVPLSIYFNERGIAKVELALARGKRKADKRQSEKKRDWSRQKARLLRDR
ncbi:MAG: SsrA-binding protein SmpB, partial [Chloroflexi bacterium]|nr:SsrA-binding protein SmpB [Chloroflexota bacterium]